MRTDDRSANISVDGYHHSIIGVECGDNREVTGENRRNAIDLALEANRLSRTVYTAFIANGVITGLDDGLDVAGRKQGMNIRSCMPFARLLRAFRFMSVFRGWDALLRLCFHPDRQPETPLEFPFAGLRYPGSTAYLVDWSAFFYGAYEKQWLDFCLSRIAAPGSAQVLDIGGNVGHHALWFAAHGCKVDTFEPNPALWPQIEKKAGVSGLTGSITLHRTAMGAADETRNFNLPSGTNQGTGSFEHEPYNWEGEQAEVRISAASDLLAGLGIEDADLVKIDVEGFEIDVMNGLRPFLKKARPVLWIEISAETPGRRIDLPQLKSYLTGEYRYFRAEAATPFLTLQKFVETDTIPGGPPVDIIAVPVRR